MELNRVLLEQRLVMLQGYLEELEKLAQIDRQEFVSNKIIVAAAESYLRRSLEVVFDIGRHILAKSGLVDLASEYKTIARGLVSKGVVAPELGEKLTQMAGYRNRLVHLYHQVTDEELYEIISHDLPDFRAFLHAIKNILAGPGRLPEA
ncbi:MAG: hypothetical protein PWQ86_175 [Bacillota bacterium]|nr:hypothetical protein [Bacillota bacterium]